MFDPAVSGTAGVDARGCIQPTKPYGPREWFPFVHSYGWFHIVHFPPDVSSAVILRREEGGMIRMVTSAFIELRLEYPSHFLLCDFNQLWGGDDRKHAPGWVPYSLTYPFKPLTPLCF